jgi:hypothetical protein
MGRQNERPTAVKSAVTGVARIVEDPDRYLKLKPAWRFSRFDWDGPWGIEACRTPKWREHIEGHLASFESMTWQAILDTSGGKKAGRGNNHHSISRDRFSKIAQQRLEAKKIYADDLFSLRLQQTIRLYGVREGLILEIVWFDPFHFRGNKEAAYEWD